MPNEPFFRRDGDRFVPQPICRGPWDPNSLHGRVVAGLLGGVIEQRFGGPGWQFTRLTTDLWRLPDFTPIEVRTELRREGGRIKVVDAEAFAGGNSIGRSTGVLLRRTGAPEGEVWSPPAWDFPHPDQLKPPAAPPAVRDWEPMWDMRGEGNAFGPGTRKRAWLREIRPLWDEEEMTPFQRVALAADFTSPMANSGTHGLQYINTDITIYLHRDPVDEWVGFEVLAHHGAEGVGVGECMLYDTQGAIGRSITAALAQRRKE